MRGAQFDKYIRLCYAPITQILLHEQKPKLYSALAVLLQRIGGHFGITAGRP